MIHVLIVLFFVHASLHGVIQDLPESAHRTICHVAICGIIDASEQADTRTAPRALQEARGDFSNFFARVRPYIDTVRCPFKRFSAEEDLRTLIAQPGKKTLFSECNMPLTVRDVTFFYIIRRSSPGPAPALTWVNYNGQSLAFLDQQRLLQQQQYERDVLDDWEVVSNPDDAD